MTVQQVLHWKVFSRHFGTPKPDRLPIVLVHGMSMSSLYMIPLAVRLARGWEVFAPDLPGYGQSQKPVDSLPIPSLADILLAWMDENGLGRAHLVGNSMGCQIMAWMAVHHPRRVGRLVMVGPTSDPQSRSYRRTLVRGALQVLFEPPQFLLVALRDYASHNPRRTMQTLGYVIGDQIEDRLPRVSAPTLVVRGAHDRIVSRRWAQKVASLLPNGRLLPLPRAGHVVNFDAPGPLAKAVDGFLRETA